MEINELKSAWQNATVSSKSEADLQRMTKIVNHPSSKKIRTKLIIETIALTLFLFIYHDWFDGDKKPLYANVMLVGGLLLYILNDVIHYISFVKPIGDENLKTSIKNYLSKIKRLSVLSLMISFLYGILLIVFFTSVINFTHEKYLILGGMITVLLLMIYFSFKLWKHWIKSISQQVIDLELDDAASL